MMKLETFLIPFFLAIVLREGDAYAYSSGGPRRRPHPRMNCESSGSSSRSRTDYFESSPRSNNRYKQRQSRVNEAFRELQKELLLEDDDVTDFIGKATASMNSNNNNNNYNPFFNKRNIMVDKETMKKWVERGIDFASDFNNDFASTSQERETNEKILQKSRDWVDRMYNKVAEETTGSTNSEIESKTNTENDNGTNKDTNTDIPSSSSKKQQDGSNNTKETKSYVSVTPNSENRSNDEVFQVAVDLPGVDRSKIDVTFEDDFLTIAAIRDPDYDDGYPKRNYQKRFALVEDDVEMDNIDATLNNGVLVVTVPKKKIETKPKRKITIN